MCPDNGGNNTEPDACTYEPGKTCAEEWDECESEWSQTFEGCILKPAETMCNMHLDCRPGGKGNEIWNCHIVDKSLGIDIDLGTGTSRPSYPSFSFGR